MTTKTRPNVIEIEFPLAKDLTNCVAELSNQMRVLDGQVDLVLDRLVEYPKILHAGMHTALDAVRKAQRTGNNTEARAILEEGTQPLRAALEQGKEKPWEGITFRTEGQKRILRLEYNNIMFDFAVRDLVEFTAKEHGGKLMKAATTERKRG